jgi:hypothetical protein
VQTFQGSFRRTCFVLPAAGETEPVQLDSQLCGGYINATTLRTMPFLRSDGSDGEIKGYICPVGQICMVRGGMSIPCARLNVPVLVAGRGQRGRQRAELRHDLLRDIAGRRHRVRERGEHVSARDRLLGLTVCVRSGRP